jgi:hypothetical protein
VFKTHEAATLLAAMIAIVIAVGRAQRLAAPRPHLGRLTL